MYGYVEVTDATGNIVTGTVVPLEVLTEDACIDFAWKQGSPLAQYRVVEVEAEDEGGETFELFDVAPF